MNATAHISQEDLALHSLQALSPQEDVAVLTHLLQCAECNHQLAEMRGDVALIGLASEQHAVPAGARQRFLNRIAAPTNFIVSSAANTTKQTKITPFAKPQTVWLPWAVAAAFALLAITLGVKLNIANQQLHRASEQIASLTETSAKARRVLDVLTSHSAQRVLLTATKTPPLPSGRAVYIAESGSLIFQASNLKQIAADKTYELWVVPMNGKPMPAGLFRPDASGSASILLPNLPGHTPAVAFGVTLEKAEGSDTPTIPMVMVGAASSGE